MFSVILFMLAWTIAPSAWAAWPSSQLANLPIATATGVQFFPSITPDAVGGAFIAWQDGRSPSDSDIYLSHVTVNGVVDPAWPVNGLPLCTAVGNQFSPVVVSDQAGGVYVAWQDGRPGSTSDIYGSHVSATGALFAGWNPSGDPICSATGNQTLPKIAADGQGGAILAWLDFRSDTTSDIYSSRILPGGPDPAWPVNGKSLCVAPGNQNQLTIASAKSGGAYFAWRDLRVAADADIRATMVTNSGALPVGWPSDGLAVCSAAGAQQNPEITGTTDGAAIVTWFDFRSGTTSDIYAQRLLPDALVAPAWPAGGLPVCTAAGNQQLPRIAPDEQNGAYIVWQDIRVGTIPDLYCQHLTAAATVTPGWLADGVPLCTASGAQQNASVGADGRGGAVVAWQDRRGTNLDIYAGHLLEQGVDLGWTANGVPVCSAPGQQQIPVLISDRTGGAILTWVDGRAAPAGDDVYAQRVQQNGALGGDFVGVESQPKTRPLMSNLSPNPWWGGVLKLDLVDLRGQSAVVSFVDISGRTRAQFYLAPRFGPGVVEIGRASVQLEPGRYFVRLRSAGGEACRALVVTSPTLAP